MTNKKMTDAERFFWKHAGYSYDSKTETPEQGHIRCAKALAFAEGYRLEHNWAITWGDDWAIGSHRKEFGEDCYKREPHTCEFASLHDGNENVLASLGCIDDATDAYRRVIEAELALEAIGNVEQLMEARREAIQHMNG